MSILSEGYLESIEIGGYREKSEVVEKLVAIVRHLRKTLREIRDYAKGDIEGVDNTSFEVINKYVEDALGEDR